MSINFSLLKTMLERKKEGKCPFCGKTINLNDFRDSKSLKEYQISGLCQKCQDKFFGK